MTRSISVRPANFGWMLSIDDQDKAVIYASGALAERAARQLAERLARAGESCEVLIFLRDGSLGGRLRSRPVAPGGRAALVQLEPAAAA